MPTPYRPGDSVSVTHACSKNGIEQIHAKPLEITEVYTVGEDTFYKVEACDGTLLAVDAETLL